MRSGGGKRLFTSLTKELALEHGAAVPTYQCKHACLLLDIVVVTELF